MDGKDIDPGLAATADGLEGLRGGLQLEGIEEQQRRAEIAAALFGVPLEPVRIGRYAILRKLGAGGMGVVYVAYDERLDRRVAVKLLRRESSTEEAAIRLEREAQAMARLSHPNVITVHEVGTHAGQVFVAMEFVEGCDLRAWLGAEQRPWRDVVEQFRQAGRGLAAAHAAGIVHRDFKPDNVLVGDDGRVRVADFGLAHGDAVEPTSPSSDSNNKLELALTRTGALAGTPAYMSPEQYAGRRTDARSDQFSFCVAMWEALYGQRPFAGASIRSLSRAIIEGEVEQPEDLRGVPPWLQATVHRGLARDPEQRWPSMQALLDALDSDPRQRWRRIASAAALTLGCVALVLLGWLAARELGENIRQRYYTELTGELLEIERDRGLRQAQDDAARARDATRMSVVRSYERRAATREPRREREHGDPTVVATLLREVEGEQRRTSAWLTAANLALARPLSRAVLRGHRGEISALVYAPDGSGLYSASTDGEIWRWDPERSSGRRVAQHEGDVGALVISDDGRWLASGGVDGSVRIHALEGGHPRVLSVHEAGVRDLAFDAGSRRLASASADGSVRIHELEGGPPRVLEGGGGIMLAVDFDPTGTWVLAGSSDARARLWHLEGEGPALEVLEGHSAGVYFVELLSAERAVTAADDGSARLWQRDPAGELRQGVVVARHKEAIAAMAVHGDQLATGSLDGSLRVTSLLAPHDSVALPRHADQIWSVAFAAGGRQVVSASFDHRARVSRADGRGDPLEFVGHQGAVFVLALDPDGRTLATGSYDSEIRVWDLQRPRLTSTLRGHTDTVFAVEVDGAGARAVTASHDGSARVWDLAAGTLEAVLDAREGADEDRLEDADAAAAEDMALNHAILSPAGERVATARNDGQITLWTLADGTREVLGHVGRGGQGAWRVAFDASGRRLAAGSTTGEVRLWELETEAAPLDLRGHTRFVSALAFEPRSGRLVTASWDASVRVWDGATGAPLATLSGHEGKIYALARSPDGHTWATGAEDGSVRLWAGLGGESRALPGHDRAVWSLAFDDQGQRLLTGGYDGRARVWSVAEGQLLEELGDHGGKVWDVAFLPDGRAVTASGDGKLRVWSLGTGGPPLEFSDHGADIQSIAVGLGGSRVISASADGTAKLWRVDALSFDLDELHEQLWRVTSLCLDADQRRRELGESRERALAAAEACLESVAEN